MTQKKIEFPPQAKQLQSEHIELLIEFLTAFQNIPQKYCLLCKAKVRLGIEAHKPSCPLRRASNLIQAAQQK
jgi:hypothetical protein